jgi:hypothetical protein
MLLRTSYDVISMKVLRRPGYLSVPVGHVDRVTPFFAHECYDWCQICA